MKLSTKGRYGLRAIIDLAINGQTEAVALSGIAERQEISISYLEQLIAKLKKAGIVNSIRGAQGGYLLAKKPEEISVGDILRALEGDLNPVDCAEIIGSGASCTGADLCVTKYVWMRISDSINNTVDTMMLSELLEVNDKIRSEHGIPQEDDHKKPTCGQ
jgi:Rrf2 family protein